MSGKRVPYTPKVAVASKDKLTCKYCGTEFPDDLRGGLKLSCKVCGVEVAVQKLVKHQYIFRWSRIPEGYCSEIMGR